MTVNLAIPCQSIKDLEALYGELGLEEAPPEDAITAACDPQLPSVAAVWEGFSGEADSWHGAVVG